MCSQGGFWWLNPRQAIEGKKDVWRIRGEGIHDVLRKGELRNGMGGGKRGNSGLRSPGANEAIDK